MCLASASVQRPLTQVTHVQARPEPPLFWQRDAAQHSADKTSLGRMIYAKVSWLPAHLLCLLWSWDLAWLSGCLAVVPGTGTGTDPLAGAMDQGKAIISGCPRRRVLLSVHPPALLLSPLWLCPCWVFVFICIIAFCLRKTFLNSLAAAVDADVAVDAD